MGKHVWDMIDFQNTGYIMDRLRSMLVRLPSPDTRLSLHGRYSEQRAVKQIPCSEHAKEFVKRLYDLHVVQNITCDSS